MPKSKVMPAAAEYAVLGVLQETPAHGYLVAQRFAPGHDLGLLCPTEQSRVYALLHDLEERGLITGRQESADPRPPRTVFAITPAGEAILNGWLADSVEPLHRLRLDFLLKLTLISSRSPNTAARLIAKQLAAGERQLADLDASLAVLDPDGLEYLVVESKRVAVGSFVTWLHDKGERLGFLAAGARAKPLEV